MENAASYKNQFEKDMAWNTNFYKQKFLELKKIFRAENWKLKIFESKKKLKKKNCPSSCSQYKVIEIQKKIYLKISM